MGAIDPSLRDGTTALADVGDEDLEALAAGMADPDVVRWIGPQPGSVADAIDLNRRRAADGSPTFAIRDEGGRFLGLVWFNRRPDEPAAGSVGYWLLPGDRGRGHATRAVRLLVRHLIADLGIRAIGLEADVANDASRRVAERAGFVFTGTRPAGAVRSGLSGENAIYRFPIGEG